MAERSPVLKLVPTTPEHLQAQAVEQGDTGSRIKSVLASSFSAARNFVIEHRQGVALAAVLTPAAIFSVDCAGGDDSGDDDGGQTFTSGQLTQTAEALDPIPTNTPVKIVEVPAATATATPTEVPPTPTPKPIEAPIRTPEQVMSMVLKAVDGAGNNPDADLVKKNLESAISKASKIEEDPSRYLLDALNSIGNVGESMVYVACTDPNNADYKNALVALITFHKGLEAQTEIDYPKIVPAGSWSIFWTQNYALPQVRKGCKLEYLDSFAPAK